MTERRPLAIGILLVIAAGVAGCQNTMWWEYRDDPYIANLARQDDQEILRQVNALRKEQREMALRIIAHRAAEMRRRGYRTEAERLDEIILRRYFLEKEADIRACIVAVCAPSAGRGSDRMVTFLRDRIAAGEFPGYAALSLAALAPRNVYADLEPLTRHPAHEVRLQAAVALTVVGDERGYEGVARVWRSMEPGVWPDRILGQPLAEARDNLENRAARTFGRHLQ